MNPISPGALKEILEDEEAMLRFVATVLAEKRQGYTAKTAMGQALDRALQWLEDRITS